MRPNESPRIGLKSRQRTRTRKKTMYNEWRIIPSICVSLLIIPCLSLPENDNTVQNDENKQNQFVTNFYSKCHSLSNDKSIIISPFSVHTCLTLLYAGTNGNTSDQLANGLALDKNLNKNFIIDNYEKLLKEYQNDDSLIKIANAIYYDYKIDIKTDYINLAKNKFYSNVESLDFTDTIKSINLINDWIKEKTNNKIDEIINENDLKPDLKIILMNAIYFNGKWYAPFDKNFTRSEDFWLNDEKTIKVDMMCHPKANRHFHINVIFNIPELESSAIEIPYDKSNLSMVIILPEQKTGLKNLENKLTDEQLNKIFNNLKPISHPFSIKIPKFKIEYEINLKEPLVQMGMDMIFTNEADFSNLSSSPLQVSKAIHKAFINVDEAGTEAAAITALVLVPRTFFTFKFHADHPFMYLIKDNNGQIFFMGRITGNNF